MKILRNRKAIDALGFVGAGVVRGLLATVRYHFHALGEDTRPTTPGLTGRYIYAFWHEYMLLPAYHYGRPDVHVLISKSDDGQLIAEACKRLGFSVVRGSTSRGSREALRQMMRLATWGHIGITPDGPRGPRRKVQAGAVYLASRTGLPIVPTGFGVRRPWRARSWDRFCVPKPFSHATAVIGPPLVVPGDVDSAGLERYRTRLEKEMNHVTALAEQWAEVGRPPVSTPETFVSGDASSAVA